MAKIIDLINTMATTVLMKKEPKDLGTRVGQFQVCVSDFFHLLNLGVCYREKNEKIF